MANRPDTYAIKEPGAQVFYGKNIIEILEDFLEWYRDHQDCSIHVITIQPSEEQEYLVAYYD